MVSKQVNERPPVSKAKGEAADGKGIDAKKTSKKISLPILICLFVAVFVISILVLFVVSDVEKPKEEIEILGWCPTISGQMINSDECLYNGTAVKKMDFQSTIDSWAASVDGRKGIVIYDLDAQEIVGSYNTDEKFATASIYKLFVVYEGYRKLQSGEWETSMAAGNTGRTVLQCLDLAIRESHSPCAETLWAMIGRDSLDNVVQSEFGLPNVVVGSLSATPTEVMKMMRRFYYHSDIVDENLIEIMQDSFLNQPVTTYNWRQGLPSGFSDKVEVYNKVGWNFNGSYWTIYDDAAIVKFVNEKRNFIVVVMTNGIHYDKIRNLATEVEKSFYQQYQ